MEAHPNPRDPLALNHKLNRVAGRRSLVTKSRPRDAKQMPEKSNQLSPDPSEIWSSSPMTSRLLRTVVSSTRHPDAQTPALDPSSTSKTSQTGSMPSLQSRAFPCMGFKVRRVLQWLRTPAGWNLGMTFFSAVFAISFGVFTILAWVVAVKANQKADLAILIAKYQYKLDEYNTNLTIFATKLAMQSRDDGRLSNRLQYYALCMSNSVSWSFQFPHPQSKYSPTTNSFNSTDFVSRAMRAPDARIKRIHGIFRNGLQQHISTGNGGFARSHTTVR